MTCQPFHFSIAILCTEPSGIGIVEKEDGVNPDEKEWGCFSPVHSPLALEEHFPTP
jgi:hypothetical protein